MRIGFFFLISTTSSHVESLKIYPVTHFWHADSDVQATQFDGHSIGKYFQRVISKTIY